MSNIMDYIDWRGDLSFKVSPFNEVDNLIFAQLSYVNFSGIIEGRNSLTIREAAEKFFTLHSEEEIKLESQLIRDSLSLLEKMAQSIRYSQLRLSNYVEKTDIEQETQFSAMQISLNRWTSYIAYRGTDDTIIGWKEDFNMSFLDYIPAQIEALNYLERTMKGKAKRIYLGGHSKGGNLAVYAAINCKKSIKRKILKIYNNDGPGFDAEIISTREYKEMLTKIITIVPESSVVGMLLEHEEEYRIIKSSQRGLMQHDALSWKVLGTGFEYIEEINPKSRILDLTLKSWLNQLDKAQREQFIDALYNILTSTQAKTIQDLRSKRFRNALYALKSFSELDKETKRFLGMTIRALIKESNRFKSKRLRIRG